MTNAAFGQLVDDFLNNEYETSPTTASYLGLTQYDEQLDDMSADSYRQREVDAADFLKRFEAAGTDLDDNEEIDRQLAISTLKGRVISASHSIGRATRRAIVSGYCSPSRLGTSSPKTMLRKVMLTTTMPVAAISAGRSRMPRVSCSQRANGAEKAASPTMPLRMLIEVMPTCTTESHLVGSSCSAIAWLAPESPASTMT